MSNTKASNGQKPLLLEDKRAAQTERVKDMVIELGEAFFKIENGEELTDPEFLSLPTLHTIITAHHLLQRPRKFQFDFEMLRERDHCLQEYVVNRLVRNLNSARTDEDRAGWYSSIRYRLEKYGLTPVQYLEKHRDCEHYKIVSATFRIGGAAYIKAELSDIFDSVSSAAQIMTEEDIVTLQNDGATANERLEALFHGVDHRQAFNILGLVEQAGFDYDDPRLVDRIMPASVEMLVRHQEPAVH